MYISAAEFLPAILKGETSTDSPLVCQYCSRPERAAVNPARLSPNLPPSIGIFVYSFTNPIGAGKVPGGKCKYKCKIFATFLLFSGFYQENWVQLITVFYLLRYVHSSIEEFICWNQYIYLLPLLNFFTRQHTVKEAEMKQLGSSFRKEAIETPMVTNYLMMGQYPNLVTRN